MEIKTKLLSEEAVLTSQTKKAELAPTVPDRAHADEIALASLKLKETQLQHEILKSKFEKHHEIATNLDKTTMQHEIQLQHETLQSKFEKQHAIETNLIDNIELKKQHEIQLQHEIDEIESEKQHEIETNLDKTKMQHEIQLQHEALQSKF
jgi:hypothetical protein